MLQRLPRQKLTHFLTSIFCLIALSSCALFLEPEDYRSHQVVDNTLVITTGIDRVCFNALKGGAIEVLYQCDVKQLPSFAKQDDTKITPVVSASADEIIFKNGALKAVIEKSQLLTHFYRNDEHLTSQTQYFNQEKKRGFDFSLATKEKILGGGQRVLGMDRRGHRVPLYNKAHYGYSTQSEQMYFGLPLVMSSKKYAVLFDNSASGFLDIGKTAVNTLSFEAVSGRSAYIVFSGDNYPKLINNYVDVTGKQPLPPRWSLGNYASRFGYKSEKQVRETVAKFIAEDIPLDAVILDLYWFGPDIKGHMGNLAWDKKTFPTPVKMIEDLKAQGIKTILITEPFILSTSKKWQEAVAEKILVKDEQGKEKRFDFYFGNTGLIDVFDENAQQWMGKIYQELIEQGVAGTWGDLGEPEVHPDDSVHFISETGQTARGDEVHNAYGHQWAKLVYENQRKLQPDVRPFIMMRSGFAGSQRYGMIPWTGDVERSWNGLKPQVELALQMGLQGLAYTHSDLGGFAGGEEFDKEMYIRWLQYGAFQPVFRPHAQDNIAPEPVFHDQETKDIIREFIKLRYRLMPYLYTMSYQNSLTGMPLMRPLFFTDEDNSEYFANKDTYLWGDAFLVSPVTDAGVSHHKTTLPKGVWFDFWHGTRYQGEQVVEVPVTLSTIPVMVKAGAFIPMTNSIQNTEQYSSEQLILHYYADDSIKQSQGEMFEDDGKSFDSLNSGAYQQLTFSSNNKKDSLSISLKNQGKGYQGMPQSRSLNLVVHNWQEAPKSVISQGVALEPSAIRFDEQTKQLTLTFNWQADEHNVVIGK